MGQKIEPPGSIIRSKKRKDETTMKNLLKAQKELIIKREDNGWVVDMEEFGKRVAFVAKKGNRKDILFYRDEVEVAA